MPAETVNGIDYTFMPLTDKLERALGPNLPSVESLQNVMLMLGDIQIVTGSSIFLVAYMKQCTITQYHFNVAALEGTAALSTYTLIAITTRPLLRENIIKPFWRWPWVMALCTASMISSFIIWDDAFLLDWNWGLPMHCAWGEIGSYSSVLSRFLVTLEVSQSFSDMVYTTMVFFPRLSELNRLSDIGFEGLLVLGMIFLYKRSFNWHQKIKNTQHRNLKIFILVSGPLTGFLGAAVLITFFLTELLTSYNCMLLMSVVSMTSTTTHLVAIRNQAKMNGLSDSEDSWGFGQLLPLLLLAIPLFETAEATTGISTVPHI